LINAINSLSEINLETIKKHTATNWNRPTNKYRMDPVEAWDENGSNFWLEKDVDLSPDISSWENDMSHVEKETFVRVLGGLTLLDTKQGKRGMPLLSLHMEEFIADVLIYFASMENIHAKSYSAIFSTIENMFKVDEVFEWVKNQKNLQYKAERISQFYEKLFNPEASRLEIYKAMVGSVLLESFLFYSGFFYPLYLAGGDKGRMIASSEIINLIIRDEANHGQFIGGLSQDYFEEFDAETQEELKKFAETLLMDLYKNELEYTQELYAGVGLTKEVEDFLKYNANNAMDNLGFDHMFEDVEINSAVENGLSTDTKNMDFFSTKGTYKKAKNVTPVTEKTFEKSNKRLEVDLFAEIDALEKKVV
jgi:ribonucleoside-diphosphate reductase beta chain